VGVVSGIGLRHYRDLFDPIGHESSETVHQVATGAPASAQWRLIATGNFVGPASAGTSIVASSGKYNTLGGVRCGAAVATGDRNTGFGYEALEDATGGDNTAIGAYAGTEWTTAADNVAIGAYCAYNAVATSNCKYNVIVGNYAAQDMTAGQYNVIIGYSAATKMNSSDAKYNTIIGNQAGLGITSGNDNTLIGKSSGQSMTTSAYNTALGKDTLTSMGAGEEYNTALGIFCLYQCTGSWNTGCGADSLYKVDAGDENTALGYAAGTKVDGASTGNLFLGFQAGPTADAVISNMGYIHNDQSDTPTMSFDFANQRTGLIIDPDSADLTNILTVVAGSATDPIADSWTNHPSDRTTKDDLGEYSTPLEDFRAVKTYRYKRKPIVRDAELRHEGLKRINKSLRAAGMKPHDMRLMDLSDHSKFLDTKKLREDMETWKAAQPKFTTERIGIMLDDDNIPPEIISEYGDGRRGIDMLGYIGYLHGAIKALADEVADLKAQN